jgi:MSHA biogenesis protein MshL
MITAPSSPTRAGLSRLLTIALGLLTLLLGGCASLGFDFGSRYQAPSAAPLMPELRSALDPPRPATPYARPQPPRPVEAEPEPAQQSVAAVKVAAGPKPERRFSVVLTNATPEVVFMALLNETPLSVAVDPAVKGPISIALKDVTLPEALDLLRELHHLDYKVIGRHIVVSPAQMQTRLFKVDYPSFNRSGRSDTRVLSGSITGGGGNGGGNNGNNGSGGGNPSSSGNQGGGSGSGNNAAAPESSRVTTSQRNDLWVEIEASIKLMIGDKDGRSVIVSPQTGNIMVRAMPREMKSVRDYLDATRLSVERQVMLEAKVVEVQLRDSERSGINWAAFKAGLSTRISAGVVAPGGVLSPSGSIAGGLLNVTPGTALEAAATSAGALMGLAFQTTNFASVLEFLGTQGNTQVLSSPRIATMNNQKAVLKVGTDDFFVTSISTTTTPVGNTSSTTPSINVTPFFSGISLDVTPSINDQGSITLHVHPAVSSVTERNKVLNLGTLGTYSLPLASSDINESDAVVRAQDGQIIAIGGLMRQASAHSDSGMPGLEGNLLHKLLGGQRNKMTEKRELVILLKPTIVEPGRDDADGRGDALQRLLDWTARQPPKPG